MKNSIGVLLTAVFMTSIAIADNQYNNPFDAQSWGQSRMMKDGMRPGEVQGEVREEDAMRGPSKEEVLKYLQRKMVRGKERISLIEQEISCVQNANEGDGSILRCYEVAQQKKQQLKRKYRTQSPSQRRNRQGGGTMPNFDRMGMGMMPMPW